MKRNGLLLLAALTSVSALMSACVVAPADPYYDQRVQLPPPPPRHEYQGYPPAPDYVWMSGYWGWGGARYEWMPGRWEAPRQGHIWVPHRWERDGDRWRQSGGRWEQDHRPRAVPPPVVMPQSAPRHERETPQYRESGGDSRAYRGMPPRGEPRVAPPVERANQPRYEQRDNARPATVNPAYRPAPAPAAAPAPAPVQPPGAKREEPSRGGDRGDGRYKRRNPEDERR